MHLINGVPGDHVPVNDRGFEYGDGLFETLAVEKGRVLVWDAHIRRLATGCRRLRIPPPPSRLLLDEALSLAAKVPRGVLKIIVTRGTGTQRGYRPTALAESTRVVSMYPWPDYPRASYQAGVGVRFCRTPLARNPILAGLKHLNRLEQVLARGEWDDPSVHEGLMRDTEGRLVSGTMSNLFLVTDQGLVTPPLDQAGVAGIMRAQVIETAAKLRIPLREVHLNEDALLTASEAFLCNSLFGIWPIRELEGRAFPAGPVTGRMQRALEDAGVYIVPED